jgi:L-aspartate oxidase
MVWQHLLQPRLVGFRASRVSHRFTDILVLGSGVAGLSACLAAAERPDLEILLLSKDKLEESSTQYAQGGIAAVLEPERCADSTADHAADTIEAACGLADSEVVRQVVTEGVDAVEELIRRGARFDRHHGQLHFTQEGGHARPRILHRADRTGAEIVRALLEAAQRLPQLTTLHHTFAIDLLVDGEGRCCGALTFRPANVLQAIWARRVVLATGGAGRLYRETTNPHVTTGDGLAMAFRAGATLRDMEFVQFHPTTLYVAGAERFLITEAVRGEGGKLVDARGERFMERYDPRGELAPRDIVSRSILRHMAETKETRVFLDLSAIPAARIREHFPFLVKLARRFGIDATHEPIPVRPSAHYTVGGVRVDRDGATELPGLFAVGEVSSTGLHGANRLGSNSLLEGLVYGRRAGRRAAAELDGGGERLRFPFDVSAERDAARKVDPGHIDVADLQHSLQSLLWREVGIERQEQGLVHALEQIEDWTSYVLPVIFTEARGWTLQNMLTTAYLITLGALRRRESRGVHYRIDFPEPDPEWQRHQDISRRLVQNTPP